MKLANETILSLDEERHGRGYHFTSKFFEDGIVSYAKQGGLIYKITKETIDKFINTIVGCPVIIKHNEVTDDNVKDLSVGVISKVWYDDADGWYWCEGVITDKEAVELIQKGWSVSCCYEVADTDQGGGVWHDIEYDAEILDGVFEHLAIVPNPRYRDATILLNSTEDEEMLRNLFTAKTKLLNSEKGEEEMAKNESIDKKEVIDEIGGMLKSWGLDEEKIRTIIGKAEKLSYDGSEASKADNESDVEDEDKEEDKKVENESESEEEDKEEEKKAENEDDEKEESEEDSKENSCKAKNSSDFEEVRKLKNSVYEVKGKSGYEPEASRLALGKKLF